MSQLFPQLSSEIQSFSDQVPPDDRREILQQIATYIQAKPNDEPAYLNFICTHNSRRSLLAQAWAHALSHYFERPIVALSGGTEVTALHPHAAEALRRSGFRISPLEGSNTPQLAQIGDALPPVKLFSKTYDHPINTAAPFAAIMTCTHAEQNCPFIPEAERRIALPFSDPKAFDGSKSALDHYLECSRRIGSELYAIFRTISKSKTAR